MQDRSQKKNPRVIELNGQALTIAEVAGYARAAFGADGADGPVVVRLGVTAKDRIEKARTVVESALQSGEAIYGVNTGFGSLARTRIDDAEVRAVQRNLIRSHAAGVGEPLPRETVRALMLLLAASLSRGHSGVRVEVVEQILAVLNAGITPVVPSRGSVGASGDLAPLSHVVLVLIGEGEAQGADGAVVTGAEALQAANRAPLTLAAKEGLALINGTHLMAALAVLALTDLERLLETAIVSAALMMDACLATDIFLDDRLHEARNQTGQRTVASRLRAVLDGSTIVTSHRENDPRVQDPYSLRCTPQVLGAVLDTITHAKVIVERELGGVTDNPQVFASDRDDPQNAAANILTGGNFHGLPLAVIMDSLKVATAHLAGISERRIYYLLAATDSENPVNAYLSPQPGLHSGLMIVQYTAAACCNEIQTLATPASVANIPTSAGQEDYNSFGPTSGHQLQQAIKLATEVIAMEFLCAAEALEYHRPLVSGAAVEDAHRKIRQVVPRLTQDRSPAPDLRAITTLIQSGALVASTGASG